ncbi:MAG: hypothetical protein QOH92_2677 [Chloroflexota bacterium]|jgi:hypothetical protein|nr:hypothetical protein [Chloroflexota bacterium]
MADFFKAVALIGGVSVPSLIVAYLLLFPEKAQIWSAYVWKMLSWAVAGANKQYLKYDLQGRINDFARGLAKDAPFLASSRVSVEWTENLDRKAFFEGDRVILRLKRHDREDANFVHGAYLFVATSLLLKVKRYIAPSQRVAVDMFVTTKLLARERPTLVAHFMDEYVHPVVSGPASKEGVLFGKFESIERQGHFYSVLLQEFDFLGSKVFGRRQDATIIGEVSALIDLLDRFAHRKIGEEGDHNLIGEYCRAGLVIIGKSFKLTPAGDVYVKYIRKHLVPKKIETVYLLGHAENRRVIDVVCDTLADTYEVYRTRTYPTRLRYEDGTEVKRDEYLAILRLKGISVFRESDKHAPAAASGRQEKV